MSDFQVRWRVGGKSDPGVGHGSPCRAPAGFYQSQAGDGNEAKHGECDKPERTGAEGLLGQTERAGEVEPTESASAANQAGHDTHVLAKALWQKLED